MQKVALDTNIAIELLNGKTETIETLQSVDLICLPVTVCGELLFGAKNSGNFKKNLPKFRAFIQTCTILTINTQIAETYSDIRKKLKDKGRPIPENDIWIAALAISNDMPLITRDKHFSHIEDLELLGV